MQYEKSVAYDRETLDYALHIRATGELDWQFVGFARTYQDGWQTLDKLVYELLTHPLPVADVVDEYRATAAETADQQADAAAPDPTEVDGTGFAGGVHSLDPDALQAAAEAALTHPALQASRWQTALGKALTHLLNEWRSGFRGDGAYFWQPDGDEGGMYAVTPRECQCIAFGKGQPCKHRAAAIILNFYHQAIVETEQVAA